MESYEKIKKVLALGFMNFLDENKPKDKMCLSNGECADIEKAFNEQDWPRLAGWYLDKYTESEDERIRKAIIHLLEVEEEEYLIETTGFKKEQFLSCLEKQKKHKFLNISAASEWLRKNVCHYMNSEYNEFYKCVEYDGSIDKERFINDFEEAMQKEQKPADKEQDSIAFLEQHGYTIVPPHTPVSIVPSSEATLTKWSEEDEKQLDDIISIIREAYEHGITISETRHRNAYSWLNNLRPSWKPSEEQIKSLKIARNFVVDDFGENPTLSEILKELQEQLEKLM